METILGCVGLQVSVPFSFVFVFHYSKNVKLSFTDRAILGRQRGWRLYHFCLLPSQPELLPYFVYFLFLCHNVNSSRAKVLAAFPAGVLEA
jgi:hypothetical protein